MSVQFQGAGWADQSRDEWPFPQFVHATNDGGGHFEELLGPCATCQVNVLTVFGRVGQKCLGLVEIGGLLHVSGHDGAGVYINVFQSITGQSGIADILFV